MTFSRQHTTIIFLILSVLCLTPVISPPVALLMGIVFAQLLDHPFPDKTKKATSFLLKASVVGLGFGMNAQTALQAGKEGFLFTVATIVFTLLLGIRLGKLFKVNKIISFLISGGTAICGGSAIAALSPVVKAKQNQISVALGVIFILNSVALLIFPLIGQGLGLSQTDFGLWCAIAIHDTSSVVGAAAKYGDEALRVATTVKLARALWIIPLAFGAAIFFKSKDTKVKIPYFIGLFVLAIIINTYIPAINLLSPYIVQIAKAGLTLTLFLIGTGLSAKLLKSVGMLPVIQGTALWLAISLVALITIVYL
ncbi:MAG: putative sulfate exporter family transporter [Chitinophagaceae bacterium]|nr:putative sulfate exporter family transporter [Chitinophagaceae bacterium]